MKIKILLTLWKKWGQIFFLEKLHLRIQIVQPFEEIV